MAEQVMTYRDDALQDHDSVGLLTALKSGEVSPTEVMQAALDRCAQVNGSINAVAVMAANPTTHDGVFGGIPTFVKDNEDVAGLPTRHGSRAVPATIKSEPSAFVDHFQRLGFTVLGKSTLPEFGLTATTETLAYGPTRNPWNTSFSTGGSSGGAAALVAAGVVPIAHANDGGGSIRIPASCCGLVGLKPSRGRLISRPELDKLPVQITAQGVVTRSVRDTALFYSEIEKFHNVLPPIGSIHGPSSRRLRIGVLEQGLPGLPVDAEVKAAVARSAELLASLGHDVEYIDFPIDEQFGHDFLRYWAMLSFLIRFGGKQTFDPDFDRSQLEPLTLELSGLLKDFAVKIPATLRRLRQFPETFATAFIDRDVIVSPVLSHAPPEIGYLGSDIDPRTHLIRLLRYASFTALQNVSGTPAITLPLAQSAQGLPIGVQFASAFANEATLLELAFEIEEATAATRSLTSPSWLPAASSSSD